MSVIPSHIFHSWATFANLYMRVTDGADDYPSGLPHIRIAATTTMLGAPLKSFFEFEVSNRDNGRVPHETYSKLLFPRLKCRKGAAGHVVFRHNAMMREWIDDSLTSPAFVVFANHGFYYTTNDDSDMALMKLRFTEV